MSIAYGVLSQPSLKRKYDARPDDDDRSDVLRSHPYGYADETLKGVLLSIVSDYLDGNLEMIRTLLRELRLPAAPPGGLLSTARLTSHPEAISDLNPSLKLSDDGINAVLSVLENIRGRVLCKPLPPPPLPLPLHQQPVSDHGDASVSRLHSCPPL